MERLVKDEYRNNVKKKQLNSKHLQSTQAYRHRGSDLVTVIDPLQNVPHERSVDFTPICASMGLHNGMRYV